MGDKHETALRTVSPGGAGGLPLKVTVTAGPDEGREVALQKTIEIGTDPSCDLVLGDPAVSRKHVLISAAEGRVVAKDLGSRNGTLYGGAKIKEIELPIGAALQVGKS